MNKKNIFFFPQVRKKISHHLYIYISLMKGYTFILASIIAKKHIPKQPSKTMKLQYTCKISPKLFIMCNPLSVIDKSLSVSLLNVCTTFLRQILMIFFTKMLLKWAIFYHIGTFTYLCFSRK